MASEAKEETIEYIVHPTGEISRWRIGETADVGCRAGSVKPELAEDFWKWIARLTAAEQRAETAEAQLARLKSQLDLAIEYHALPVDGTLEEKLARIRLRAAEAKAAERQLATERSRHANICAEFEKIAKGEHPRYWVLEKGDALMRRTSDVRVPKLGDWIKPDDRSYQLVGVANFYDAQPIYRRIDAPADAASKCEPLVECMLCGRHMWTGDKGVCGECHDDAAQPAKPEMGRDADGARIRELEQLVADFKAASMLECNGDPDPITPQHVEREITQLRQEVGRLRETLMLVQGMLVRSGFSSSPMTHGEAIVQAVAILEQLATPAQPAQPELPIESDERRQKAIAEMRQDILGTPAKPESELQVLAKDPGVKRAQKLVAEQIRNRSLTNEPAKPEMGRDADGAITLLELELWNGTKGELFRDLDGELGIMDEQYSIILNAEGEARLREVLCSPEHARIRELEQQQKELLEATAVRNGMLRDFRRLLGPAVGCDPREALSTMILRAVELLKPNPAQPAQPEPNRGDCPACGGTGGKLLCPCKTCEGTGDTEDEPHPRVLTGEGTTLPIGDLHTRTYDNVQWVPRTDAMVIERHLLAQLAQLQSDNNRLNSMLKRTGYGQGQIDAHMDIEEENEKLKAEVAQLKQQAEAWEKDHRAMDAVRTWRIALELSRIDDVTFVAVAQGKGNHRASEDPADAILQVAHLSASQADQKGDG